MPLVVYSDTAAERTQSAVYAGRGVFDSPRFQILSDEETINGARVLGK